MHACEETACTYAKNVEIPQNMRCHVPSLPSPATKAFASANIQVDKELQSLEKQKRSTTHCYEDEIKMKTGRYAVESGNTCAVIHQGTGVEGI